MLDTDPSPEPQVRRSRAPLAWLVVLLLVLGGAWAWHAWNTRAKHQRAAADDASQRLTALEDRLATLRSEQRAQQQRLQQAEATNRVLGSVGTKYSFSPKVVNNLDGSGGLIKNHSDVTNAEVTYAVACAIAATT